MTSKWFAAAALVIGSLAVSLPAPAQEAGQMPEMSPEDQAMMQKWMEFATPGEPHQNLARVTGKWTAVTKWWMKPGDPPTESNATSEAEMIMGGRYLVERVQGTMMGQPFSGMSITGYDNLNREYRNLWIDNMGTGFMLSTGKLAEDGKSVEMTGTTPDPMTGKDATYREVEAWPDPDTRVFTMYGAGPDGAEMKTMEITYKRVK